MKQMISLRGECQKSNKELKECEFDAVTSECHTQIQQKLQELYRGSWK